MRLRTLAITLLALPLIIGAGCSGGKQKTDDSQKAASEARVLTVKTALVEAKTIERSVEAVGTLFALEEAVVSAEVTGRVQRVAADLGDRVKAGQALAIIDPTDLRLALDDAKSAHRTNVNALDKERARLADAETTLKRYDELYKKGMVSNSQFDTAKTQFDVAKAQLSEAEARAEQSNAKMNLARERLDDATIKSPIDGEVRERFISKGETIEANKKAFAVVSTGVLKFRGTVAETAVPHMKPGQAVMIAVEAFKDREFKGVLKRVSPAVDAETRTLAIEAEVPNVKGELKPGFFAKARIFTKKESGVPFAPESAVYSFVGITKVFVIKDGVAHEKTIKTGERDASLIEIVGDVKPGDTVASTNLANLFEGAKVNISE
ncbi:MAG: efflux RND transporter periplasmic adaptor subunit [Deltaproteobacteria bacterium]|nr:efflux RND transporter periplasmic adaptor subunit [Deltaproteobacteria bacterium]